MAPFRDAARNLADKAAENFARALQHDYRTTLGVCAEDTAHDEAMIADAQAECEALYAKIVRDLQTTQPSDVNRVRGYTGEYIEAVVALFKIATLEDTDLFLDIAP